ncbi:MAG: peptidyl-prolyl cis-trans isomerase [Lachnospiraceae bacterium]|nr:peptidyl-prolyl cis-trans isomerase [Lachnospiraceae bacterium]
MNRMRMFLAGVMIITLLIGSTGCANGAPNEFSVEDGKNTIVMSLGDYDVTLSEFNLYLIQYLSMQQLDPNSLSAEQCASTLETVVSQMKLELVEYLLALSMTDLEVPQEDLDEVPTIAANYIEGYGADFLTGYGIDQASVEQLFTEQVYISALTDRAKEDMAKDYYEQYSEEYKDKTFHSVYYALFPSIEYDAEGNPKTDGEEEYITLSDEAMKEQKTKAEELQKRATKGEALEDLIEEYGISYCSGSQRNYNGAYDDALNKVIENMKEGDISEVIETDAGYMIVRMDNPNDTEYKEYVIDYAAKDTANNMITQMQTNWLQSSGYANVEADTDILKKIDVKKMCQYMKKNGIY